MTKQAGVAIIGQTGDLAPADKRVYATRDITATVDNISLITASILSKKLAAGLESLVMDVKVGSGAFMPTYEASEELAKSIVAVANGAGTNTTAILTDMNQVLASSAGNAVEVREAVRFLTGEYRNPRLLEVTMASCAEMLVLGKLAKNTAQAREKLQAVLDNGQAADRFGKMVAGLGGPSDFVENYDKYLAKAEIIRLFTLSNLALFLRWIPVPSAWRWSAWAVAAAWRPIASITLSALISLSVWVKSPTATNL